MSAPRPLLVLFGGLALAAAPVGASTGRAESVRDIAARGACSTAGVEGLSAQLAEAQRCLRPGRFVSFAPHAGITLASSRVHPYLQASARDALWAAAARRPIRVNSAFRTVADQYVLYHSGGCGLAATPGRSNHQSGRAVDVGSYATVRSVLEAAGCTWLGSRDPVHFDCPGVDGRPDSVLAFQRLWNTNQPEDRIAEDGDYGPQTEARLARSPAGGFPRDGCGCEARCEGSTIVAEDCSRGDCAAYGALCSTAGAVAPRCVSVFCVSGPDEVPSAHAICLPDGRAARCTQAGGLEDARDCPGDTTCEPDLAECVASPPPLHPPPPPEDVAVEDPPPDGAPAAAPDAGAHDLSDPRRVPAGSEVDRSLTGGCSTAPGSGQWPVWAWLALVALWWRRRGSTLSA